MRSNVGDIYFVNYVRDSYGCDAEQGRNMFDRIGRTLKVRDERATSGMSTIHIRRSSCSTDSSADRLLDRVRRDHQEFEGWTGHRDRRSRRLINHVFLVRRRPDAYGYDQDTTLREGS